MPEDAFKSASDVNSTMLDDFLTHLAKNVAKRDEKPNSFMMYTDAEKKTMFAWIQNYIAENEIKPIVKPVDPNEQLKFQDEPPASPNSHLADEYGAK
jgi:hypothetical protein